MVVAWEALNQAVFLVRGWLPDLIQYLRQARSQDLSRDRSTDLGPQKAAPESERPECCWSGIGLCLGLPLEQPPRADGAMALPPVSCPLRFPAVRRPWRLRVWGPAD